MATDPKVGLKLCPFCGSDDARIYEPTCDRHTPYDPAHRAFPVVTCGRCYASVSGTDWDKSAQSAFNAWNRRSVENAIAAIDCATIKAAERRGYERALAGCAADAESAFKEARLVLSKTEISNEPKV